MKQISDEEIIKALAKANGFVGAAARSLGCCRWTVSNRINENDTVREAYRQIVEDRVDTAESKLMDAVNNGNLKAIMFLLSAKGKQRGYGDGVPKTALDMDFLPPLVP